MSCIILLIPIIFPNIYAICLFNFLNGIISCIKYPWINSFIPLVVRAEDLDNANSSISFSKTSGQLIMPLLSGVLFATTSANMLYVLNIIFLILALFSYFQLSDNLNNGDNDKEADTKYNRIKSLKLIIENKTVLMVCLILAIMLFLDGAMDLILLVVTKNNLQKSDSLYGAITTIQGLGMTLASISAPKWIGKAKKKKIQLLYILGFIKIVNIFVISHSPNYLFLVFFVFIEAYFWISMTIIENTILQSAIPSTYRGAVYAIYGSLCWLASFLGTLVIGSFAEKIELSNAMTIEAILSAMFLLIIYFLVKKKTDMLIDLK